MVLMGVENSKKQGSDKLQATSPVE